MKFVALALALAGSLLAVPVYAWDCKGGVPDTPENEVNGMCVLHTATPVPVRSSAVTVQQRLSEVCHYEASTGMWELRHVTSGNERVEQGDHWPVNGICIQEVRESVASGPQPVVAATPESTPESVQEVVVTPEVPTDVPTEVAPPEVELPPAVDVPEGLPNAGDPDALAYCGESDAAWWDSVGRFICQ